MRDLLNFYQITPTIGTAGQPTTAQLHDIAGQGFQSVVNLAMHDSDNAIPEEGSLVTSLGMTYVHLPVPFERPLPEHLGKFFRVMAALEGENVLVHCAVNARVSAFMYKYLTLCRGLGDVESTSPLLAQWLPRMDPAWRAIMALRQEDVSR